MTFVFPKRILILTQKSIIMCTIEYEVYTHKFNSSLSYWKVHLVIIFFIILLFNSLIFSYRSIKTNKNSCQSQLAILSVFKHLVNSSSLPSNMVFRQYFVLFYFIWLFVYVGINCRYVIFIKKLRHRYLRQSCKTFRKSSSTEHIGAAASVC